METQSISPEYTSGAGKLRRSRREPEDHARDKPKYEEEACTLRCSARGRALFRRISPQFLVGPLPLAIPLDAASTTGDCDNELGDKARPSGEVTDVDGMLLYPLAYPFADPLVGRLEALSLSGSRGVLSLEIIAMNNVQRRFGW